jgi:hypothetical protein
LGFSLDQEISFNVSMPKLPERQHDPLSDAMYDIAEALQYPVDSKGRRYNIGYILPVIAFHLARAGAVIDPERAIIRKQPEPPPDELLGTEWAEAWDAVNWVDIDAPATVDDELAGATLADLPKLSAAARAEFIRRAGGEVPAAARPDLPTPEQLDERVPWRTETSIQFDDDEEPNP